MMSHRRETHRDPSLRVNLRRRRSAVKPALSAAQSALLGQCWQGDSFRLIRRLRLRLWSLVMPLVRTVLHPDLTSARELREDLRSFTEH